MTAVQLRRRLTAVALGLVLFSCSSDDSSEPQASVSLPPASPEIEGYGECTGTGALTRAVVSGMGKTLQLRWETTGLPASRAYYVMIESYQIGLKVFSGDVSRFVFDLTSSQQENLTSSYTDDGTTATLVVPTSAVPRVGDGATWNATVTNTTQDLGQCPAVGDASLA